MPPRTIRTTCVLRVTCRQRFDQNIVATAFLEDFDAINKQLLGQVSTEGLDRSPTCFSYHHAG